MELCTLQRVPSPGLTATCRPLLHLVFHWLMSILQVRYTRPLEADGASLPLMFLMLLTRACRPVGVSQMGGWTTYKRKGMVAMVSLMDDV